MSAIRWGLRLLVLLACPTLLQAQQTGPGLEQMKKDLYFLASEECQGRGPDTKGINLAANYIADSFKASGLAPAGKDGSYFQHFTIKGPNTLSDGDKLVVKLVGPLGQTITLVPGTDFNVMGLSGSGSFTKELVFVGFGISDAKLKFDEYKDAAVKDKIVVALRRTPRFSNEKTPFGGSVNSRDSWADLRKKVATAVANKAAGFVLVNDSTELDSKLALETEILERFRKKPEDFPTPPQPFATYDQLEKFSYLSKSGASPIPALHVRRSVIDAVVQNVLAQSLRDIEQDVNRDLTPKSAPLVGWKLMVKVATKPTTIAVKNVIGVLEGNGPLAKETIVVGAHYDHLGFGVMGGSLAKEVKGTEIHYGADDNASGTTTILEVARRFGQTKARAGRRLVFIAFSAEELGLLGSAHYVKEPIFPLEETAAMLNLDMVGRLREGKINVEGTGTGTGFDQLVDRLNTDGLKITKRPGGTGPSDHDTFFRKKIPVLFFFTGSHSDYHRPSDTADKINLVGMKQVADLAQKIVVDLSGAEKRPEFVAVASPAVKGGPSGPKLGLRLDYNYEKEGVYLEGVVPGGAAEKGGLKDHDVILEIAGKQVTNLQTYMTVMSQQVAGKEIEVVVRRKDQNVKLKVVPQ